MQHQPDPNTETPAEPVAPMPEELIEALKLYRGSSMMLVEASGRLLKAQGNMDVLAIVADNRFRTAEVSALVEVLEEAGITTKAKYFAKVAEQLDQITAALEKKLDAIPKVATAIHVPNGSKGPRPRFPRG